MRLLGAVQIEINKALEDRGSIHQIYLNRVGEVERCSYEIEDVNEPDYASLMRQAPTPNFEVCSVSVGGTIFDSGGDSIEVGDNDALQAALDNAISERTRFYTEREQQYGPSAWPIS